MPTLKELAYAAPWIELVTAKKDWDGLDADVARRMHQHLHIVRAFEEAVLDLEKQGLVHGPAHSSIGQDGAAVACMASLDTADAITGSHRGHHQFLAKCLRHLGEGAYAAPGDALPGAALTLLRRTLAEICGLSEGFCKGRGGSMHLKWVEAGAYGTNAIVGGGVPLAAGLAWAKRRQGKGAVAFTFLGDGAMNIGAVSEAMNLAALWQLPVCFFIENNGYAVSTTLEEQTREQRLSSRGVAYGMPSYRVDGMDPLAVHLATQRAVEHMRAGKGPVVIEAVMYRYFHHGGSLAGSAFGYRSREEEALWRQRDPLLRLTTEATKRGWVSELHDAAIRQRAVDAMRQIIEQLTEMSEGKRRIRPALWPDRAMRDDGLRSDLSELDGVRYEEQESASGPLGEVKFVDAVAQVMNRRMETDERIFCVGEDIHRLRGGTNGATKGLAQRFSDRIVPAPIAEEGFVGVAGGVALEGSYRPVVELMYADFALVAADQLFNQVGKMRHMFGGDTGMPLVLRTKCAMGTGYGAQHSMDPAGLYSMFPGWRIVAPSNPFDYVGLMNSALRCEDPVLVIEHTDLYNVTARGPLEDHDYYIPLGKAKVVRPGAAFTVLTYLSMVPLAVRVAQEMGIDAEIVDLRSLDRAGLDWDTIGASVRKTNNVVVLEQGPLTASYGAMLVDELQRRLFDHLDQPVQRIHGAEASPSVSKVLERAAFVGAEEVRAGFTRVLAAVGKTASQGQNHVY
jgi:2-oxoisovalerate dehydrogenase E1 component